MWTGTETEINILWLRHGSTRSNEERRYLGKTQEGLAPDMKEMLSGKGENIACDYLITSPMLRCIQTAELLFDRKPDWMIPKWEEINFGEFEGKNYEELKDDDRYQKWLESNGTLPFPGGESQEEFKKRTMEGFQEMLDVLIGKGVHNVVCIVHGGSIMSIMSSLTGEDYFGFQVKCAEGYKMLLRCGKDGVEVPLWEKYHLS